MPPPNAELRDVVEFVLERAEGNDLEEIAQAMETCRQILQERDAAEVTEQMTVTLAGLTPQYLNGLSGVVTKIARDRGRPRVTVTLDKRSANTLAFCKYGHVTGHDSYDLEDLPLSCCKVVSS